MARSAAMASNSCKVFNLDVSLSISLGARTRKGGKRGGGVREEGGKEGEGVREEGGLDPNQGLRYFSLSNVDD